jgi:hypothetical protein
MSSLLRFLPKHRWFGSFVVLLCPHTRVALKGSDCDLERPELGIKAPHELVILKQLLDSVEGKLFLLFYVGVFVSKSL